jgi:hypothetical protein
MTPKYETNVSDERLDIILSNECGAPPGLATSRFRRLANEIADRDERPLHMESISQPSGWAALSPAGTVTPPNTDDPDNSRSGTGARAKRSARAGQP